MSVKLHKKATMAFSNKPLQRYLIINQCLRNTMRQWTKTALLQALNQKLAEYYGGIDGQNAAIQTRQLNNDLSAMQTIFGAPIQRQRRGNCWYFSYDDPQYSIENQQVSQEDLEHLRMAVHLLQQISGFALSADVAQVVDRLESKLKYNAFGPASTIAFENAPVALGTHHLPDMYAAIQSRRVLKVMYQPYQTPHPEPIILHPYFLKEYNNRWFVFGYNPQKERIYNLALDRVVKVSVTQGPYVANTRFDSTNFFKHIVGVTLPTDDAEPCQVLLKLAPHRAPYVLSKPIHHSQTLHQTLPNGFVTIGLTLVINKELVTHLLSYGPDLQVLQPANLRQTIAQKLHEALAAYHVPGQSYPSPNPNQPVS
ncbi:MAG: WYL domain-containing protein [Bacteroidetes bacterium]|nr:MAG: WYL domain-containing protein [Bacteroidota bacterium]